MNLVPYEEREGEGKKQMSVDRWVDQKHTAVFRLLVIMASIDTEDEMLGLGD